MFDNDEDPFAFLGEPIPPTDARALIPDFVLDELPDGVDEVKAAQTYAYHLIWQFKQPKMLKTVRDRILFANRFLMRLAEIDPDLFDEVICAYAERALIFDQPNAA